MLKKIMTLALAVMALAAVAAPLASANWTHNKVKIPAGTNPQIEFLGQANFISAIGNVDCQTVSLAQFTGGQTTGHITKFEINPAGIPTEKCVTGGPLAACKVTSLQATQLPWLIHSDGADKIMIRTGEIHLKFEAFSGDPEKCTFLQEITLKPAAAPHEFPNWNVPAGQTSAITQVHLQGKLTTNTGAQLQFGGTQTIQAPNAGTYGTA